MEVTILGSGSPPPATSRGGQSLVVTIGDHPILVDCGPMTVERLVEAGVALADVETLFFSHQHMDHNASFFHFAITSWMYGRRELTVYGPAGTERLLDALVDVYREDLEYRREFGRPTAGITEIGYEPVADGFALETPAWTVSSTPVEHTIETHAYRFDTDDGSVVYSADTAHPEPVVELADGADVLVMNCGVGPEGSGGTEADRESWRQYLANNPRPEDTPIVENHCDPETAGRAGAEADVGTLVLTHLLPVRDEAAIAERAATEFGGEIHVGTDGLRLQA